MTRAVSKPAVEEKAQQDPQLPWSWTGPTYPLFSVQSQDSGAATRGMYSSRLLWLIGMLPRYFWLNSSAVRSANLVTPYVAVLSSLLRRSM